MKFSAPIIHRSSLILLLATTACMQAPAQVSNRGQEVFTRDGQQSVAFHDGRSAPTQGMAPIYYGNNNQSAPVMNSASVSQNTQQTAPVNSISSSDLAPPSNKAAEVKNIETAPVNPWTKKPRDEQAIAAQETHSETAWSAKEPATQVASKGSFIWPVASKSVISSFGAKGAGKANDGVNIQAAKGDPVWAAGDGEVVYAANGLKGYGNMVLIKHNGGKTTTYAHLARMSVEKYDRVKQGDIIGYVGQTGNVKAPQLHFAMRQGTDAVDPQKFMASSLAAR